ncbi:hypothetical protein [Sediminivirga luteola]|uniref:Uncharacterized protein n=1 Tax=Sediminivirga luteola TaxID=1774748 RepID=A0A8J2XLQ4_9MICO|nr:hypothetical protein [Sediminivirga luteola]MCI2265340.1 hypothetical protein [Sediminivirga luteola]GGA24710.1 hypothetical protein GCM10011333_29680 [Sediminivirga luteola]
MSRSPEPGTPGDPGTAPVPGPSGETKGQYLFVWNDTVRGNRLVIGVVIGIVCALVGLYGGRALIGLFISEEELIDVWSLVTGIVGCVVAGFITAIAFRPARVVSEDAHESGRIAAAVEEMAAEPQGLGTLEEASELSRREIEEAGLTEVFREAEARAAREGSER